MVYNNLSPNWSLVKLGDVCEIVRGGSPRPMGDPKYFVGDIPFIKISDITKDNSKYVSDAKTRVNEAGSKKSRLLPKGSLILSNSGSVCIPKFLAVNACIHDGFVSFNNFKTKVELNFLFHYFNYIRPFIIQKHKQGITQVNLNISIVSDFDIPLPPFSEQKKIVEKIEKLFTELDSGVTSLKKAKEQIKLYRQSVLSAAFSGQLLQQISGKHLRDRQVVGKNQHLPYKQGVKKATETEEIFMKAGWKWVKLGEVIEVKDGTHDTPKYKDEGIPFLTQKNIKNGKFVFGNYKLISEEDHNKFYKRSNVVFNDIIISMIGANRGMSTIVKTKEIFSIKNVGLIKTDEKKILSKFLDYFFKSEIGQKSILSKSKGGAQQFIGLTELRNWLVPYLPITQQIKTVEKIEKRFLETDNIEKAIDESLSKAEMLRQSILKQAFEGRLV